MCISIAKAIIMTPALVPPRDWSWAPFAKCTTNAVAPDSIDSGSQLATAVLSTVSAAAAVAQREESEVAAASKKAKAKAGAKDAAADGEAELPLEAPFCLQVSRHTFARFHDVLTVLMPRVRDVVTAKGSDKAAITSDPVVVMTAQVLKLLRANLARLVESRVDPEAEGIILYVCVVAFGC